MKLLHTSHVHLYVASGPLTSLHTLPSAIAFLPVAA